MARNIAVGVGLAGVSVRHGSGFWRWVDLCEAGGVDCFWQTDRLVSRHPILECMTALAALAGRTRRIKFGVNVLSLAMRDPRAGGQAMRDDRCAVGRAAAARPSASAARSRRNGARSTSTRIRAGRKTDEALEVIRLSVDARTRSISTACITGWRRLDRPEPGAARPADVDRRRQSEAAIRRTARFGTGWQAGPETPAQAGAVDRRDQARRRRNRPRDRRRPLRRRHPVPLRPPRRPGARDRSSTPTASAPGAIRRDYFAIGDAEAIVARIADYVEAGVSKFILRPVASGDDEILDADAPADRGGAAGGGGAVAKGGEKIIPVAVTPHAGSFPRLSRRS